MEEAANTAKLAELKRYNLCFVHTGLLCVHVKRGEPITLYIYIPRMAPHIWPELTCQEG